jgi:hypothetical protein
MRALGYFEYARAWRAQQSSDAHIPVAEVPAFLADFLVAAG